MDSKDFYRFWNYIEKRAFLPGVEKEIGKWLRNFNTFFDKLYERECAFVKIKPEKGKFCHKIAFDPLGITCDFVIFIDLPKFSFTLKWRQSSQEFGNECSLQFEYDGKYFCEFDYLEEHCREMSNDFSEEELENVLRNKIDHPALHYHIKDVKNSFPHDIRIAAAAKNPFLLLYQAAYQFLHFFGDEKKQQELKRLTNVIFKNKDQMPIASGILFGI